jgi:hypothetical protein
MKNSLEPLSVTGITTVTFGTAVWAALLVVALLARNTLVDQGRGDWVWIAAAGTVLGLLGIRYTKRRAARIAQDS